ncbi:uncharacterized protein LOC128043037 [Gossypium raimondii]|uniref:uncharacterized protein LOC128043037 n=1 Tax=Gossypium raimondii TaxID=29730 RepID=UPI00227A80B1|nr:uncharacterized protein LOC128043037 [Gossypium raimondii]
MLELKATFAHLSLASDGGLLAELQVRPTLAQQIKKKQPLDGDLLKRICQVEQVVNGDFDVDAGGILNFRGRLCVPQDVDLRQVILTQTHSSPQAIHPGSGKMYHDLCEWEKITRNFFLGLPLTPSKKVSIWVIVHQFSKSAHFLAVRTNYSLQNLEKLYIVESVRLYRVSISIISDRDPFYVEVLEEFARGFRAKSYFQYNLSPPN